jgi:predicted dehydrogenase/threonine dehydrogenase-like Zn-dependent dehydrogenase
MQHVTQNYRNGKLSIDAAPDPVVQPGHVLIANRASVISAGTERWARENAKQSIFGKARQRPDQVLKVLRRIGRDGLRTTVRQVRDKLDEPMSLGYCSAGVVLACGFGVQEFKPGDRVASNGPHAEVVCVPRQLCARIPDEIPFDQAALAVLGAIALQGVRLSQVTLGETAFVIGLGLVGQLTVALVKAAGGRVIATDPDESRCRLAAALGADLARSRITADEVLASTGRLGADCVLITAATPSNGPVELAGEAVRKKGRVVAVGAVGMDLPRNAYYYKEAEFIVSCSYGPGRYDPAYEAGGRDYPAAFVRWTEQRNIQAVLDLASAGRLDLGKLISHRFSIQRAAMAYELIETAREPYLGIVLEYPERIEDTCSRKLKLASTARSGACGVGCLGTGDFARAVLLPALGQIPAARLEVLCSARGVSAAHLGTKLGFATATSDEREVFDNPRVDAVFIATRHDQHARQLIEAIRAGKHAFIEKPLALNEGELQRIEDELADAGPTAGLVMVDFNRRFSQAARIAHDLLADIREPLTVSIRLNAGSLPPDHWVHTPAGGGRIVGEACHAIDLATYLIGSVPTRVFAESVGGAGAPAVPDERCFITLRHASGSVTNVAYLAGGDPGLAKERIEIFGGGQIVLIDDFRTVIHWSRGKQKRAWRGQQDKGHRGAVERFFKVVAQGGPAPISWAELRSTALASILAVRSLREGGPLDVR